jgi:hypothetical protein
LIVLYPEVIRANFSKYFINLSHPEVDLANCQVLKGHFGISFLKYFPSLKYYEIRKYCFGCIKAVLAGLANDGLSNSFCFLN